MTTQAVSNAGHTLRPYIQKVATGPEYSQDLDFAEAYQATKIILSGQADPVQIAVLLIGLRMKRETNEENGGMLKAIIENSQQVVAPVDQVLDVADPYDGYTRCVPVSPFLPAVLAACGLAAVSHGVKKLGPKFGATHHSVLSMAGMPVDKTPQQAAACLANDEVAWAYIDQQQFCPRLHALVELRTQMIKRPALTTVEVLTGPLRGRRHTHLLTGYVHKAYPPVYAYLAEVAGFDSAILVRGVEGGVMPSLRQPATVHIHDCAAAQSRACEFAPDALGIKAKNRAVPLPENFPKVKIKMDNVAGDYDIEKLSQLAVETGLDALNGKSGLAYNALLYAASVALSQLQNMSLAAAAEQVHKVMKTGRALAHFQAFSQSAI